MKNDEYNLFGDWNDRPIGDSISIEILDRWFDSEVWDQICEEADYGDEDSVEFMETISNHLANMIFHLEKNSSKSRIDYELKAFSDLVKDYLE